MMYTEFDSPLCGIILAGDEEGLAHLHLKTGDGTRAFAIAEGWKRDDALFADVREQIDEYFAGERTAFDVRLRPSGTAFQMRVWQELSRIRFGEVRTYKDIAVAIGNPKASRAVGMANSRNPIPLIVPCHRVVGANGKLTGFAHGLAAKQTLLALEQQHTGTRS